VAASGLQQHDSGPYDGQLLGELLQAGVVMLDGEQRCRYASPRACAHLGETDEAALVNGWPAIRATLGLDDITALRAGDPPLQRRCDLSTASGTRKVRFEVHALGGGSPARYLMLLRERSPIDRADRLPLMASECEANRHAISSLVHDAKGPLNNIHLTLALLASAFARMDPSNAPAETLARCRRYVDVIQTEETRLAGGLNDIHALARRDDASPERIDVGALLGDIVHVLRHEARLREAKLQLDVATSAWTYGDPHQLRLALFAFCACVVEAARPRSVITLRVDAGDDAIRISIAATGIAIPADVAAALFRISGVATPAVQGVVAGRTIVEAQGGDVALVDDGTAAGFSIGLTGTAPSA
jgi:signal transduction histidine kinase